MEKTWLHRFGFSLIFLSVSVFAQDSANIQSTVVDVEVPIQAGNLADAKQAAQKLAFEKAVDQYLPATMEAKIRAEKIKIASSYIKSFKVLDERQEGALLKVKVRCDLIGLSESTPGAGGESQKIQRFEITWKTSATQLNSSEFLDYLRTNLKLNIESFKLGRGIFLVNIMGDHSAGEMRVQMSQFLGALYNVRILEDESNSMPAMPVPVTPAAPVQQMPVQTQPVPGPTAPVVPNPSPAPTVPGQVPAPTVPNQLPAPTVPNQLPAPTVPRP